MLFRKITVSFFGMRKKTGNALHHGSTWNFFYCRWNRRNRYEKFDLAADVGLETYGICSDKFLNEEFKNVRFEMKITIHNNDSFSYDQDSQLQIKGNPSLFHHTDKNTRSRVK